MVGGLYFSKRTWPQPARQRACPRASTISEHSALPHRLEAAPEAVGGGDEGLDVRNQRFGRVDSAGRRQVAGTRGSTPARVIQAAQPHVGVGVLGGRPGGVHGDVGLGPVVGAAEHNSHRVEHQVARVHGQSVAPAPRLGREDEAAATRHKHLERLSSSACRRVLPIHKIHINVLRGQGRRGHGAPAVKQRWVLHWERHKIG